MIICPKCSASAPEGSSFCPSCATPLSGLPPPGSGQPDDSSVAATRTSVPSRTPPPLSVSSPSLDRARFLPGAMLADRYRVIGLIGRGGMGEVYRADDLKLGQPVALKFLPSGLDKDQGRLARFLNEVKLSRQVSHPNVCRVYDVGETDGQHFLSMELVDGEDLASLLRRVGRLPSDRATRMARQLCAGLAAAHEQGILHRDLKPANVLVDGHGRAKITDFGLAGLADTIEGDELRAGTPTFMAPEQLAGKEVSIRSDIYSLGLVLYELFTGKPAFKAKNMEELARLQSESRPASPTSFVDGFDPAVERVILHCLEREPASRPASAIAVAASLPGGDPLAAALAAGETPSPELVAAAGEGVVIPRWLAWTCLAVVLAGLPATLWLADRVQLHNQVPLDQPPEVLRANAQQVIRDLGYDDPPEHTFHDFRRDDEYLDALDRKAVPGERDALLRKGPAVIRFGYRQSPEPLKGMNLVAPAPSLDDPPLIVPGMMTVELDTRGRLLTFIRVPTDDDVARSAGAPENAGVDWSKPLAMAGLGDAVSTAVEPRVTPPVYADTRSAWEGEHPAAPGVTMRLEAAALGGRPVFFRVDGPWVALDDEGGPAVSLGFVAVSIVLALVAGAFFLGRRNYRQGRGDLRGAKRVAIFVGCSMAGSWLFYAEGLLRVDGLPRLALVLGISVVVGTLAWAFYMALEPVVRRRWPDMLVSWARLLEGRWRDPMVGRDLLVGAALAIPLVALDGATVMARSWAGLFVHYERLLLDPLLGGSRVIGDLLASVQALMGSFAILLILVLFRTLLRRTWAALLATLLPASLIFGGAISGVVEFAFIIMFALACLLAMIRLGFLAGAVAIAIHFPLAHLPVTADLGAWHADMAIAAIVFALAVAIFGFVISFGGQSLFSEGVLEGD